MIYKAISLWQPWASLVVDGHKKIETRSWNTDYRGLLLIHASAAIKPGVRALACSSPFCDVLPKGKHIKKQGSGFSISLDYLEHLPFGAIIGAVQVRATHPTNAFQPKAGDTWSQNQWSVEFTEQELAFGDYTKDRHLWLLSDPIKFKTPIPCKGMQGFWKPDADTSLLIEKAISEQEAAV